jgi:hypothetical protein
MCFNSNTGSSDSICRFSICVVSGETSLRVSNRRQGVSGSSYCLRTRAPCAVLGFQFERRLEKVCVQSRSLIDTAQGRRRSESDYISHSNVWSTSAIFVEEDDAQNGVDHVDGHRSPGYIVSPYAVQGGPTDNTYYTQVNMTRTIEQILGLPPMNQFDLVASPMGTDFVKGQPPAANFQPWTHVPNQVALNQGVGGNEDHSKDSRKVQELRAAWLKKKAEIFAGKLTKPDSEDPDTVNHLNWYMSTGFTRPYPGEKTVRPPSEFNNLAPAGEDADD